MARIFRHDLPDWWCKGSRFLLALCWISGLMFGVILSESAGEPFFSLMHGAANRPVSIISLLMTVFLPFLLTALAVYVSEPRLLLVLCFLKAACFSFVSLGAIRAFHSAGWLIRWLLMFADLWSLPFLYGFWRRHISGGTALRFKDMAFVTGAIVMCSLDYFYISPFLAELVQF